MNRNGGHNEYLHLQLKLMLRQVRRQDSVTRGGRNKFGGAREVYLCELQRGTGAREIHSSVDQMNKVKTKDLKEFSGRNRNFKRFVRSKTGDLQKNKKKSSLKLQGIFRQKFGNSSDFSGRRQVISKKKKRKKNVFIPKTS